MHFLPSQPMVYAAMFDAMHPIKIADQSATSCELDADAHNSGGLPVETHEPPNTQRDVGGQQHNAVRPSAIGGVEIDRVLPALLGGSRPPAQHDRSRADSCRGKDPNASQHHEATFASAKLNNCAQIGRVCALYNAGLRRNSLN